ncbi:MAG: hypothetical protein KF753_06105 [Caldilineaceae bacterium]|nr:hypothetical protein [Caldilineaceae bacterium]
MLNQDFKEFIQSLNENKVEYLVVGGYTVDFHGHPRYTKDIDIRLRPSKSNAQAIMATLVQFGFGSLDIDTEDILHPDQIIQLGYPPARIDLLTTIPGVNFDECYQARIQAVMNGVTVSFIDLDNLKTNKRASGRLQDLADVESLESPSQ